jgi:tetratricopeptide (TPR) repeat protein
MTDLQQEQATSAIPISKKNQQLIIYIIVGGLIAAGGILGYTELYQKPREAKAADAMFLAEKYFAQDSSNLVLNGDGTGKGVLYIIKEFGGTSAANLAKYYAGISYFRLGDFNKSLTYLKDFSTNAKQVQAVAYGTMGDAYAELKKNDEAIESYKKAGAHFPEDAGISSEYLYRAASLLEMNGKVDDAIAIYQEIKVKYPSSEKGMNADKYIYRLKVQP